MVEVYTIQMAQWRKAKALNIELIDTTVKSGIPAFAPLWSMVESIKTKQISEAVYTEQYRALMLQSYFTNSLVWNTVIQKESIALACYCSPGEFCHRHLLVGYLEKICQARNIPFVYKGELQ